VTLLVLDELNTHFSDVHLALDALRHYVQKQPETLTTPTLLAVVSDKGFKLLQDFTRSRDALLQTLNAHKPDYAWKLELGGSVGDQTAERLDISVSAVEQLAQYSARIPGRKNLVWVGQGFPSLDPDALGPAEEEMLKQTMQHVTDTLLDRRITLYAVDPTSNAPGMTELTDDTQVAFAQAGAEGAARTMDPFNVGLDFDKLGPVSGGRVLRGLNDVDHQIATDVELGEQYYSIGYSPSGDSEATAKYRKITVKCARPGVAVMTREGYYSGAAARQQNAVNSIYDLNNAVASSLPFTALRLRAEPLGANRYNLHVSAPGLSWSPNDNGEQVAHAQVLGAALTADGKVLAHTLHTMTAHAQAGTDVHSPSLPAEFTIELEAPAGTARLRFIVRDVATGAMGSFDLKPVAAK
jgi:VWFA-related protein